MKKSRLTKVLAVILSLTMIFSSFGAVTVSASHSYPITDSDDPIGVIFSDIIDTLFRFVLDMFSGLFKDGPGFVPSGSEDDAVAANYYEGIGKNFATEAEEDAQWNIGYANASLIPEDYSNGTYYLGGYISMENGFSNVVEGIAEIPGIGQDDMKVRCIAVNDGTGKGTVLFATIDCIGITNADIKDIRALLAEYAANNDIAAINIASTHTHSCIDTEGLWTKTLEKMLYNGINSGTGSDNELVQGTNPAYMAFLKEKVADALIEAYSDMKPGKLTYAVKDIGQDYFNNKNRPSAGQTIEIESIDPETGKVTTTKKKTIAMTDITRFVFTPNDQNATPTMLLNIAAHPDVAGLPTSTNSGREISGDYLFYCGKYLEDAGYNFMFFQGAIAGIYMARGVTGDGIPTSQRVEESQRFGFELARMALSLTLTEEEIKADSYLNCADEIAANVDNDRYTIWYEGWEPVQETEVEPFLNLYLKQVEIPVSNSLIEAVGKLNMANYVVISHDDGTYSTVTEIGYMEMGNQFKTVFLPGEICQDLIVGGDSLSGKNSVSAKDFTGRTAVDIFGEGVTCFGLMNDAIGYVVPDNDYTMGDPVNHYHELISLGQGVASALMEGLEELANEIVR